MCSYLSGQQQHSCFLHCGLGFVFFNLHLAQCQESPASQMTNVCTGGWLLSPLSVYCTVMAYPRTYRWYQVCLNPFTSN